MENEIYKVLSELQGKFVGRYLVTVVHPEDFTPQQLDLVYGAYRAAQEFYVRIFPLLIPDQRPVRLDGPTDQDLEAMELAYRSTDLPHDPGDLMGSTYQEDPEEIPYGIVEADGLYPAEGSDLLYV